MGRGVIFVTAGCSFLLGLEMEDPSRTYNLQLARHFGYEIHNISEMGSANEVISRRIIAFVHNLLRMGHSPEEIKVLCAWSVWERHNHYDAKNNSFSYMSHYHTREKTAAKLHRGFNSPKLDQLMGIKDLSYSVELSYYEYIYARLGLELFLKSRGIEYFMTHARRPPKVDMRPKNANTKFITSNMHETLDESRVFQQDFLDFTEKNGYPKGPHLHPLEQAHDEYTKVLIPFITDNRIFT
jgi:hypothetical protein